MNLIVNVDKNWGIGNNNKLLVNIPDDLKYFKEKTLNSVVVMGRKTLESLPNGKPLPERINIVLSKDVNFTRDDVIICRDYDELFVEIKKYGKEVFVIGGASIYNGLMRFCEKAFVTKVDSSFEADTFINNIDELGYFKVEEESEIHEFEGTKYQYIEYKNDYGITI